MEFFMASITVVTLLPILININPVNANSSKPYCNTTRRFHRTSIEEVQHILADAVEELNNTCHEIEVVSKLLNMHKWLCIIYLYICSCINIRCTYFS